VALRLRVAPNADPQKIMMITKTNPTHFIICPLLELKNFGNRQIIEFLNI
jgi:hypothetical protein